METKAPKLLTPSAVRTARMLKKTVSDRVPIRYLIETYDARQVAEIIDREHRPNHDALVDALTAVEEFYAPHFQGSIGAQRTGPLSHEIKAKVRAALAAAKETT